MKGQRLFIRPIEASDAPALTDFLALHAPGFPVPACGLLAKLVGDIVAVIALDLDAGDSVRITGIVVAATLRKKRIGRSVVEEAAQLARKLDRATLVAGEDVPAEFLRRVGFEESGSLLVRRV
jgi:N-acetylglutamate synthase-like GNAT family acetyltransferase